MTYGIHSMQGKVRACPDAPKAPAARKHATFGDEDTSGLEVYVRSRWTGSPLATGLFELFLKDVSGAFYAPYAVLHPVEGVDSQGGLQQMRAEAPNPPALTPSPYDPPALVAVKPAPTNTFRPNFVPFSVEANSGSLSKPIPPAAYGLSPVDRAKWLVSPAVRSPKP